MIKLIKIMNFIFSHPLGKRHKLIAVYHFFKWQFVQFFKPGTRTLTFLNNTKVAVNKSDTGVTGNIYVGLHDFNEISFALHLLEENDVFVDVGANVGFYSLVISNSNGVISYAFEPVSSTYSKLNRNIQLNNLENKIISLNAAVGSIEGNLKMTNDLDTVNHIVLSAEACDSLTSINVIKLDTFFSEIIHPKLIKIDVEGFEYEVICGMESILRSNSLSAIIIELNGSGNRYGFDDNMIHEKLLEYSFHPVCYDPFSRNLSELDSFQNGNTIYVKDLEYVQSKLDRAKTFSVFGEVI